MAQGHKEIKVRVSGVLVRDGRILTMLHRRQGRQYHVLPGGGLELQESIPDCLRREFREETTLQVKPGRLLAVIETIPARITTHWRDNRHVVELVYWIDEASGYAREVAALSVPAWVEIAELLSLHLYPRVNEWLARGLSEGFGPDPAHFVFPVEPVGTKDPLSFWPDDQQM
ncbi:MAG: NUDIX domain-containing protein [Bacillota bacterium]